MITVTKNEFLNAIRAIKSSCGKNSITPILGTVHIKTIGQGLQLTTTDTVVSARTVIEANVNGEPIEICINIEKLENIVNALNDLITIDCPEQVATIKSGKTKFEILTLDTKDYPLPNFNLTEDKIIISKNDFIKGVNKTIIATAPEKQSILNGICLTLNENGYEMAATDGNRLSQVKFNETVGREGQYIIPHHILANMAKVIKDNVEIYFDGNRAILKSNNFLFSTMLIAGTYPQYTKLLPQSQPIKLMIKRNELCQALERVAIMSDNKKNITVFNFKNDELHLTTACDGGKAEDTLEINFNEEFKIAFNFKYILEGIKAMETDDIEFQMKDTISSCLIVGDFRYLVMPIVIKE